MTFHFNTDLPPLPGAGKYDGFSDGKAKLVIRGGYMSDTLLRENEFYEIHVVRDPDFVSFNSERNTDDGVYHILNKETGVVEAKVISLPQAIIAMEQYQQFLLDNEKSEDGSVSANDENIVQFPSNE